MVAYFGNYKPGSWWVYLNRDSTKRDSIYIDNYGVSRVSDIQFSCTSADEVDFNLHSKYFDTTRLSHVIMGHNGQDLYTNTAKFIDSNNRLLTLITESIGVDSFEFSKGQPEGIHKQTNYQLWYNQPTYILPVVTVWGNIIIAPDLGIVQYEPYGNKDTFTLIKSHFL